MKILITGSSGLLGGHILKKIKKNKKNKIFHNGILKKKTDLSKEKNIEKFLLKNKIDLIINCAGYTNIDFIEEEKKLTDKINIDLLKIFFKVKKKHNLKFNLIHFSTDQLYGKKNIYHKETSKIFTFNHYCKQKILSEKICKKNKSLIFRTNFFGKSTNKKSNHNKPTFTDWIYNKFTAPDDKFYLFKDIYFNPIYVGTLSNIVCKIIDDNMHDYRGIFNIGSKFGMNKKNFACHFAKAVGIYSSKCYRSVASSHIFKTKRTKYMMMNSKKFKNTFKIKLNSLKDEIKKAAKYYKKN